MNFDANTIIYLLEIIVGGLLVGIGVHFVPVGGAPAAMAQATGIGTGTVQLAAGSGLTGLLSAGLMMYAMSQSPTFAHRRLQHLADSSHRSRGRHDHDGCHHAYR